MKKEDPRLKGLCKECAHRNTCKDAKRYLDMIWCSEYRHWKRNPKSLNADDSGVETRCECVKR